MFTAAFPSTLSVLTQRGKESSRAKGCMRNAWQRYENLGRMRRNSGDNCRTSMGCGSILFCMGTSHKQDCFMHTLLTLQAPSLSSSHELSLKVLWYLLDPAEEEGTDCPSVCLSSAYGHNQQLIWYCTPPLIWIDLILKPLRSNKFCLMGALPEPQKSLKRVSWVKAVDLDFSSIWQAILRTWKEADLRRDDFQQAAGHFGYIRVIREDLMHSNSLKLVFPILAMFYPNHHPECYLLFRTSCLFSSV